MLLFKDWSSLPPYVPGLVFIAEFPLMAGLCRKTPVLGALSWSLLV